VYILWEYRKSPTEPISSICVVLANDSKRHIRVIFVITRGTIKAGAKNCARTHPKTLHCLEIIAGGACRDCLHQKPSVCRLISSISGINWALGITLDPKILHGPESSTPPSEHLYYFSILTIGFKQQIHCGEKRVDYSFQWWTGNTNLITAMSFFLLARVHWAASALLPPASIKV
jgi:hypothetical protein